MERESKKNVKEVNKKAEQIWKQKKPVILSWWFRDNILSCSEKRKKNVFLKMERALGGIKSNFSTFFQGLLFW